MLLSFRVHFLPTKINNVSRSSVNPEGRAFEELEKFRSVKYRNKNYVMWNYLDLLFLEKMFHFQCCL